MLSAGKSTLKSVVKEAERACSVGDFRQADELYTRAIEVEPSNPVLYGNRSAARIKLSKFNEALSDAGKSVDIDANYAMGYFRLAIAQQCIGELIQAIVSFSEGIVRDQKIPRFISGMVEVALESSVHATLKLVIDQLRKMHLDNNPFIITSVIGQELLSHNHVEEAVQVLENAVAIGTRSLKLKGSVFSALSSALWSLGDAEKATFYMKEDLNVSRMLSDNVGECRAHGNLGAAFYSQGEYKLARENHNRQLALAQNMQDERAMASAFSSLAHIHTAVNDHKSAAESHKQSAAILRNVKDVTGWCRELGLVASSYIALGDLDSALQWQLECLRVTTDEFETSTQEGTREEAKSRVDLAAVYHKMQKFKEEISCLQKSVDISRNMNDLRTEAQTLTSLGYITRQTGDLPKAQSTYERLLELALSCSDRSMEARACANLGVIHHQLSDFDMALKLQARNLELSRECRDVAAQGRAHGNIGNAYSAMGMYQQAIQHHINELEISSATSDRASECSTHGNLAVAYQALNDSEKALHHFNSQIFIASEIGDSVNESRAYMNLANFYSSKKEFRDAICNYKKYLEINENCTAERTPGVARACYNIGFAHFSLREYSNAIEFYEQSLKIALENEDTVGAARAYCNLGLAWKAQGDRDKAFECQNSFLSLSNHLQSARGVFKALGNLGDLYVSQKQPSQAISYYQQQLELARQGSDKPMIGQACAALGAVYRLVGDYQNSLSLHTEELNIFQEIKDARNEFKAHGHLGAALTSLSDFSGALECYESQCLIARQLGDAHFQSISLGNMGITSINMQEYKKAIGYFEQQLENSLTLGVERSKIFCNIGDCYEAMGEFDEAISMFEEGLALIADTNNPSILERAYRGLSSAYKLLNKPKEAFSYCQLRINACHLIQDQTLLAEVYGEMGYLFTVLTDYNNALSCLKIQMEFAGDIPQMKADAACGLGSVYQIIKSYKSALEHHQLDLQIALDMDSLPCQGRAHGNLGAAYESLHEHSMAVKHQEQHLFIADSLNDPLAKLTALRGIGRNMLRLGTNQQRAALLLQQALLLAREMNMKEDEGKVTLDLGLAFWICGDLNNAEIHLLGAVEILTEEFWKSGIVGNTVDISIHPNSCIDLFEELSTCHSALAALYSSTSQHTRAIAAAEKMRSLPEIVARKRLKKKDSEFLPLADMQMLTDQMVEYSTISSSVILYYSICAGNIFTWVITPDEGLCGFFRHPLFLENTSDDLDKDLKVKNNLLSYLISELQDSLGVDLPIVEGEDPSSDNEDNGHKSPSSLAKVMKEKYDLELLDNSNSHFNIFHRLLESQIETYYSKNLSALGISGPNHVSYPNKPPIYALYDLLIGGVQNKLQKYASQTQKNNLVLVLEGELLLVPFALLKKRSAESYLSQQFVLRTVTSAQSLLKESKGQSLMDTDQFTRAVVIGNPFLADVFDAPSSQSSEEEANLVGSILKTEPIVRKLATKENVVPCIEHTECVHFACKISMKRPYGVFLSSQKNSEDKMGVNPKGGVFSSNVSNADSGIGKEPNYQLDDLEETEGHKLSDEEIEQRSLTFSELINFNLSPIKIAVVGSAHLQETDFSDAHEKSKNSKLLGFSTPLRSFLTSGVQALLVPLWPVPETACKMIAQSFYSRVIKGIKAADALNQSIEILRSSEQFEHPSYWAGFVLIGRDITFDPRNLALTHGLALLIKSDPGHFHDTLRLVLHLIDKCLERIGSTSITSVPMYTAQASISKKVQNVKGWRELFSSVGFELRQSTSGLPDAVFFPPAEMKDDLEAIKPDLVSFLQLPVPVLTGISRLFTSPYTAHNLTLSIEKCLADYLNDQQSNDFDPEEPIMLKTGRKTWQTDGCDDLLSALGFNVSQIGEENVMLHCTSDSIPDIENVIKPMRMFFGDKLPNEHEEDEFAQMEDETKEEQDQEPFQTPRGSQLANFITRGLPPSSRRSIAVDFSASFKSQSSSESTYRIELPDHMTNMPEPIENAAEEPKQFSLMPSSENIVIPKPVFPQGQVPRVGRAVVSDPPKTTLTQNKPSSIVVKGSSPPLHDQKADIQPQASGNLSLKTIQRSSRFQFHKSSPSNQTMDNLEVKLPKSPQRSPMFYRKQHESQSRNLSEDENSKTGNQEKSQQVLALCKPPEGWNDPIPSLNSKPEDLSHFIPIEATDKDPYETPFHHKVVYPTPKMAPSIEPQPNQRMTFKHSQGQHMTDSQIYSEGSQGQQITFKNSQGQDMPSYIPAPSVASSLAFRTNSVDYASIVDKLTRLSTDDLSQSSQETSGRSNIQGHFKGKQNIAKDGNNNQFTNQSVREKPHESTFVNKLSPDGASAPFHGTHTHSFSQVVIPRYPSPFGGAVQQHPTLDGTHHYSLSLDSASKQRKTSLQISPQDGSNPPPYKYPEIVTSPRRSSTDTAHSRASSLASQGSYSSTKSSSKKDKLAKKTRKTKNQEGHFDEGQVSYQLQTNLQGNSWFIEENIESLEQVKIPEGNKYGTRQLSSNSHQNQLYQGQNINHKPELATKPNFHQQSGQQVQVAAPFGFVPKNPPFYQQSHSNLATHGSQTILKQPSPSQPISSNKIQPELIKPQPGNAAVFYQNVQQDNVRLKNPGFVPDPRLINPKPDENRSQSSQAASNQSLYRPMQFEPVKPPLSSNILEISQAQRYPAFQQSTKQLSRPTAIYDRGKDLDIEEDEEIAFV